MRPWEEAMPSDVSREGPLPLPTSEAVPPGVWEEAVRPTTSEAVLEIASEAVLPTTSDVGPLLPSLPTSEAVLPIASEAADAVRSG